MLYIDISITIWYIVLKKMGIKYDVSGGVNEGGVRRYANVTNNIA